MLAVHFTHVQLTQMVLGMLFTPWGYYNFPLQQKIETIKQPKLIVTGEKAHSRYMAEEAYNRLKDPKELVIVPNATHVDLYDQMDKIPFDKFDEFFKENL